MEIKNPYILDIFITTLEDLLKDNHVDVKIPLTELGTYCDVISFINKYSPKKGYKVNLEVQLSNGETKNKHFFYKKDASYSFNITAVEGLSPEYSEDTYSHVLLSSNNSDQVSITCKNTPKRIKEIILKQNPILHQRLKKFLPEKIAKCTLYTDYMYSKIPLNTHFYNHKRIAFFVKPQSEDKFGSEYPISTQHELKVPQNIYLFIEQPIFWGSS